MDIGTVIQGRAAKFEGVAELAPCMTVVSRALGVHDGIRERHAAVSQDAKLTTLGRQADLRQFIGDKLSAEIYRSERSVEFLGARLAAWRTRLGPQPVDKTNVAAAVLRSDARAMLREKGVSKSAALLLAEDADPVLIEAALEGPPALSGLTSQIHGQVLGAYIEKHHGPELRRIERAEAALEVADVATQVAATTARAAADFPDDRVFADFVSDSVGEPRRKGIVIGIGQEWPNAFA